MTKQGTQIADNSRGGRRYNSVTAQKPTGSR
jgi:hypothetical protein